MVVADAFFVVLSFFLSSFLASVLFFFSFYFPFAPAILLQECPSLYLKLTEQSPNSN